LNTASLVMTETTITGFEGGRERAIFPNVFATKLTVSTSWSPKDQSQAIAKLFGLTQNSSTSRILDRQAQINMSDLQNPEYRQFGGDVLYGIATLHAL